MITQSPKPPLGLMSKHEWDVRKLRERNTEILDAMTRYARVQMPLSPEWFVELAANIEKLDPARLFLLNALESLRNRSKAQEMISVDTVETLVAVMRELNLASA